MGFCLPGARPLGWGEQCGAQILHSIEVISKFVISSSSSRGMCHDWISSFSLRPVLIHFLLYILSCRRAISERVFCCCCFFFFFFTFMLKLQFWKKWSSHHSQQRVQNAVIGYSLKNNRMISVHFQGKPFSITVIQAYAATSKAEEAEVEWFYEDL